MTEISENSTVKNIRLILEQLNYSIKRSENTFRKKDFQFSKALNGLFHCDNVKESFIWLITTLSSFKKKKTLNYATT